MNQIGMRHFKGKRVWVIGATSGIGEACAIALFAEGASVALSGRRVDKLQAVAQHGKPNQSLFLPLDVTDPAAIPLAHQRILQDWGQLDLLLFVSGIYIPLRADNFEMESAEKTIDANVLGPMRAVAAVLPDMLQRRSGHIAIVGSVAGYSGLPKALAYGPSKAAMINFCETLFYDLQPLGIGVHMISPGFVKTEATAQNDFEMPALISAEEAAKHILDGIRDGEFDIHFPKRFSGFLKFLRLLPYPIYFWILRRFVKI
ncbi:MAG: SDR family NAD(P)-dependent oxidoreductase [Polynucleobacter sp.]|jgi:NADP-dependent 3-hydroxy acid dehydrogenase YdfG|nr:SDR family NAD(P)-dependent oxidoreductase [Polynucleobacter sp.]MDZ4056458.1 SDR family NAD(P)-dependent oxidoreductase [Polynucleobacter sp.]